MRMLQTGTAALFSLAALLVAGASEAGEITVMSTVAVREPYLELVPAFERATENKVATMWVGVSAQNERIKGGEIVDLVIGVGDRAAAYVAGANGVDMFSGILGDIASIRLAIGRAKLMMIGLATPTIEPLTGLNDGGANTGSPV